MHGRTQSQVGLYLRLSLYFLFVGDKKTYTSEVLSFFLCESATVLITICPVAAASELLVWRPTVVVVDEVEDFELSSFGFFLLELLGPASTRNKMHSFIKAENTS